MPQDDEWNWLDAPRMQRAIRGDRQYFVVETPDGWFALVARCAGGEVLGTVEGAGLELARNVPQLIAVALCVEHDRAQDEVN